MTDSQHKTFNFHKNQIRQAWSKRQRTVKLGKNTFKLSLQVRNPTIVVGGTAKKVTEKWLVATPADGRLVPCYNISLKPGGNARF